MNHREPKLISDEIWRRVRFCARAYTVVAYLEQNPRPLSLAHAATIAGMERTSFCRLFRRRVGMGFSEFVSAYRLEIAMKRMVESDDSLTRIAADVGFGSVVTFQRCFFRCLGVPPSTFRAARLGSRPVP